MGKIGKIVSCTFNIDYFVAIKFRHQWPGDEIDEYKSLTNISWFTVLRSRRLVMGRF